MKKTFLLTLLGVLTLLILSVCSLASADSQDGVVTVTYRVELASPIGEIPEFYDNILGENNELTLEFEKGHCLGTNQRDIPRLKCAGDVTYNWNIDPHGYVLTEDITFIARIDNDGTVPAFFRAVDKDYLNADLCAKLIEDPDNYADDLDSLIVFTKKGEVINPDYIPIAPGRCWNDYVYTQENDFEPSPDGLIMNEPTEFICYMTPNPVDTPPFEIKYKVGFTTPMEIPEGYFLMTWDTSPYYKNDVITTSDLPTFRYLGEGMKFDRWDVDPVNTIVKEDMTFTAIFNNDGCVPIFFKAVDEDGKAFHFLENPSEPYDSRRSYTSFVAMVKKGDLVDEKTVPALNSGYDGLSTWNVEPIGHIANEPFEFVLTYKYYYWVRFLVKPAKFVDEQLIHRGEAAQAPEVPEVKGYLFTGWDADFSNITDELTVNALMYKYGDTNMDGAINTADATQILKHCAGIKPLKDNALKLADATMDKNISNYDAVQVLRDVAGMN